MSTLYTVSLYEAPIPSSEASTSGENAQGASKRGKKGAAPPPRGAVYRLPETRLQLDVDVERTFYEVGPYYCFRVLLADSEAKVDVNKALAACDVATMRSRLVSTKVVERVVPSNRDVFIFAPSSEKRNQRANLSVELTDRGLMKGSSAAVERLAGSALLKLTEVAVTAAAAAAGISFGDASALLSLPPPDLKTKAEDKDKPGKNAEKIKLYSCKSDCADDEDNEHFTFCGACTAVKRLKKLDELRKSALKLDGKDVVKNTAWLDEERKDILRAFARTPKSSRIDTTRVDIAPEHDEPVTETLCIHTQEPMTRWLEKPAGDDEDAETAESTGTHEEPEEGNHAATDEEQEVGENIKANEEPEEDENTKGVTCASHEMTYKFDVTFESSAHAEMFEENAWCHRSAADSIAAHCTDQDKKNKCSAGVVYRVPMYGDAVVSITKDLAAKTAEEVGVIRAPNVVIPHRGCYAMAPNRARGRETSIHFKIDERTGVLTSFEMKATAAEGTEIDAAIQPVNDLLQKVIEKQNAADKEPEQKQDVTTDDDDDDRRQSRTY